MNIETIATALDTLKSGLTSETEIAGSELQKLSEVIENTRQTTRYILENCIKEIDVQMREIYLALEAYHSDRRQAMSAMIAAPAPMQQAAE